MSIFYPALKFARVFDIDTHLGENDMTELKIGDLVAGANVVDLTDFAFVKNGIKGVGGISCKEVPASWTTVSMEDDGLAALK